MSAPRHYPQSLPNTFLSARTSNSAPALSVYYYSAQLHAKAFTDVRVRQGANRAIDSRSRSLRDVARSRGKSGGALTSWVRGIHRLRGGRETRHQLRRCCGPSNCWSEPVFQTARISAIRLLYNTLEAHKKIAEVVADHCAELEHHVSAYTKSWQSYRSNAHACYDVARAAWVGRLRRPEYLPSICAHETCNNKTAAQRVYAQMLEARERPTSS